MNFQIVELELILNGRESLKIIQNWRPQRSWLQLRVPPKCVFLWSRNNNRTDDRCRRNIIVSVSTGRLYLFRLSYPWTTSMNLTYLLRQRSRANRLRDRRDLYLSYSSPYITSVGETWDMYNRIGTRVEENVIESFISNYIALGFSWWHFAIICRYEVLKPLNSSNTPFVALSTRYVY